MERGREEEESKTCMLHQFVTRLEHVIEQFACFVIRHDDLRNKKVTVLSYVRVYPKFFF